MTDGNNGKEAHHTVTAETDGTGTAAVFLITTGAVVTIASNLSDGLLFMLFSLFLWAVISFVNESGRDPDGDTR